MCKSGFLPSFPVLAPKARHNREDTESPFPLRIAPLPVHRPLPVCRYGRSILQAVPRLLYPRMYPRFFPESWPLLPHGISSSASARYFSQNPSVLHPLDFSLPDTVSPSAALLLPYGHNAPLRHRSDCSRSGPPHTAPADFPDILPRASGRLLPALRKRRPPFYTGLYMPAPVRPTGRSHIFRIPAAASSSFFPPF